MPAGPVTCASASDSFSPAITAFLSSEPNNTTLLHSLAATPRMSVKKCCGTVTGAKLQLSPASHEGGAPQLQGCKGNSPTDSVTTPVTKFGRSLPCTALKMAPSSISACSAFQ